MKIHELYSKLGDLMADGWDDVEICIAARDENLKPLPYQFLNITDLHCCEIGGWGPTVASFELEDEVFVKDGQ